jgi:hypothetical protein
MSITIKINDKEFEKALKSATAEGIARATQQLHTLCKLAVGKPNTGVSVPVKRRTPGGNKRTRTIYPNPSKPGEPPRVRTGFGRANIVREINIPAMAGRVGVRKNALYMIYLDLGTRTISRRPWLVATLLKNKPLLVRLIKTGAQSRFR